MVSLTHTTVATGDNDASKQVSVTAWNEDHSLTGTPNQLLGFDQDGATIEIPLVTPQMYGAVGDGVADDASALQAAIDYALANKYELHIPAGTYSISATLLVNDHYFRIRGDGWGETIIKPSSAIPACIVSGLHGTMDGISFRGGAGCTVGLILKNAGGTKFHGVVARDCSSHGILLDPDYGGGADGNNNLAVFSGGGSFANGGCGVRFEQHGDNNGISFVGGFQANANTSHGLLLKSEGWFVETSCITEGNGGYGVQIGEDADSSSNTNGRYDAIWTEGNTLGDVRSTANSGSNLIEFKSVANTYSKHASAVDVVNYVSAGIYRVGSNDGDSFITLSALSSSAYVLAASKSAGNVNLIIGGTGTGIVISQSAILASGNITATQNGSTLGGAQLTRGAGSGYLEVYNPTGTRQCYGFYLNGAALQFDAESTATHFQFLDPVDVTELRVSATKVVGARGAAVADATDAATVITQLNALLARLRTHGLIAT